MHVYRKRQAIKPVRTKTNSISFGLKVLRFVAMGVGLFVLAAYSFLAQALHQPTVPRTAVTKSATHHVQQTPKVAQLVVAPSSASSTPKTSVTSSAPSSTSSPAASAPTTPAPTSSVSSLTPSSPTTPSGSSSGGTSGSSSTTGGSGSPATTSYTSTNWAGYVVPAGTFSTISASWMAPRATGNGTSLSADATWIGIGGVTTGDLIQVGTQNTVSSSGQTTTSAFYELLPSVSRAVPGVTVSPGDLISASLTEISSGQWTISISDNTASESFTDTVSYVSSQSSAEWIEEAPSFARGGQIPLDNFGTVSFAGGATTDKGNSLNIASSSAGPITMVNASGQAVATPSAIGSDGASFSITRNSAN